MSWSKKEIPTSQFCNVVNRGIDPTDEITSPKYTHYLCFSVKVRTDKFVYQQLEKYSPQQEEIFNLIKSLRESGMGYRKISYYLNKRGILTHKGKSWRTGHVYSVLKRHNERLDRIEYQKIEYEPEWGDMTVE